MGFYREFWASQSKMHRIFLSACSDDNANTDMERQLCFCHLEWPHVVSRDPTGEEVKTGGLSLDSATRQISSNRIASRIDFVASKAQAWGLACRCDNKINYLLFFFHRENWAVSTEPPPHFSLKNAVIANTVIEESPRRN